MSDPGHAQESRGSVLMGDNQTAAPDPLAHDHRRGDQGGKGLGNEHLVGFVVTK